MIAAVVRRLFFLSLFSIPIFGASVSLRWDPSPDVNLAKYRLYRGTASKVYDWTLDVQITTTNAFVTNLVEGQVYYFAVTVFNTNSVESDFSNEIAYTAASTTLSNTAPTAANLAVSGTEDQPISIQLAGSDANSDPLSYQIAAQPAHGTLNGTGPAVTYTPDPNYFGTDQFTYTVSDGKSVSAAATVSISVQAVNDAPTLNAISSILLNEDAPSQTVSISGISAGGGETQPLTVTASVSGTGAISSVTVNYTGPNSTGTLSFTPVPNAFGTNQITITVNDGQSVNNTATRSFFVVVNPVNDPPTLNSVADINIAQNSTAQTVALTGVGSGAPNESQTLAITATSSNPTLIPNPTVTYTSPNTSGSLQFTPAANQSGNASITVTLADGGASNNIATRIFKVTIATPPTITGLTETASDARSLTFKWTTDQSATCMLEYGTTAALGFSASSTYGTTHSTTLSNLQPATTYYLKVRASGPAGISETPVQNAVTEPIRALSVAAESAVISLPMTVYSSTGAQNGKFIGTTVANLGSGLFNLNMPYGLNYRVWSRVKTPAGGGSFYVSVDGGPEATVTVADNGTVDQWRWVLLGNFAGSTPGELILPMNSGIHVVAIRGGMANTGIDEFALVNDPTWLPILATTKPQLTVTPYSPVSVDLTWSFNAGNATTVGIEQSIDGIVYSQVAFASTTTRTYRLANLNPQRTYYFRIVAYNSVDRTAYSNVAVRNATN
jgi:hypothetical protein